MKNEVSLPAAGITVGAVVLVIVLGWFLISAGTSKSRNVGTINAVAHRLGQVQGDVTKLSADDQEFIKSHPRSFSVAGSRAGQGPSGVVQPAR